MSRVKNFPSLALNSVEKFENESEKENKDEFEFKDNDQGNDDHWKSFNEWQKAKNCIDVKDSKGNKPVPILFPKKIQEYIQIIILDIRKTTKFVPKENPFLFALPGSSKKWIDGSTALRKLASDSGAENPKTLTSSRLRKQIATVLQILNLSDIEMEQVANFMGHTKKTHEEFYRLPHELSQTTKIAKLLLKMNSGINKSDQGKTLEELDYELESEENDVHDDNNDYENELNINDHVEDEITQVIEGGSSPKSKQDNLKKAKDKKDPKTSYRGKWTGKQKI